MVCVICVQMISSAAGGSGKQLRPGCLCLNPDDTSDTNAVKYSQPLNKENLKSHLDPSSDHLTWETTNEGDIRVKRFDENRLAQILKDFASAFKSSIVNASNGKNSSSINNTNPLFQNTNFSSGLDPSMFCCFVGQSWNWSYQRAVEMKSDSDHILRAVQVERQIVRTAGKSSTTNTNQTATSGSYWSDYEMWQRRVLGGKVMHVETNNGNPTSWDLIHLAVATGGLGASQVPVDFVSKMMNSTNNNNSSLEQQEGRTIPLNFFQLVDLSSRAWKQEKAILDQQVQELNSDNKNPSKEATEKRQSLFTKDRILRATQAKILAAKCLASRKFDYPSVIEDYCEPAAKVDPQAARESAFIFLSKGYEANIEHRKRLLTEAKKMKIPQDKIDPNLKLKWYMFYDEVAAPIVMFPCSTCPSPCMSAPQNRLPWGGSVSVGELRQKLDTLAPGFVDVLQKYNVPMECESVKARSPDGATPALPDDLAKM